ncbi:hypothetical protein Tco_0436793 [Tanacetum coccineum]
MLPPLSSRRLKLDTFETTKSTLAILSIMISGLDIEVEILSSDDDRTKFDNEKAESEKHDDDEVADKEETDDERIESEKDDQEMGNVEKIHAEKAEEEKADKEQSRDEQAKDDQVQDDQAGALVLVTHKKKPELLLLTSSHSIPSNYVQQEIPTKHQTPLLDVLVSVIPEQTTPPPKTPPKTTEAQADLVLESDSSTTVLQRLSELKNQIPKFFPKAVLEFVEPRLERTIHDMLKKNLINLLQSSSTQAESLSELELKKILMDKRQKSRSYLDHDKRHDLYDAFLNSINQDPHSDSTKEKKKKRRKEVEPSKKSSTSKESSTGKTPPKASKTDKSMHAEETVEEPTKEVAMEAEEPSFADVVNDVDQPQDDTAPKKDTSNWFKQPPRPKTPDL